MEDKKPKVFIIDNEIDICQLFKDFFDFIGYDSFYEVDGEKALAAINSVEYDIMFVDLRLNSISGIEILKKSKALKPISEVIVVTGFGSEETIIETIRHGAFAYIQKPISFSEVKVQAEEALAKSRFNSVTKNIHELVKSNNRSLLKHFDNIILLDKLSESLNLSIDIDTLADSILRGVSALIPGFYYSLMYHDRDENWLVIHSRGKINKETYMTIQQDIKNNFEKLANVKIDFTDNVRVYLTPETEELDEETLSAKTSLWVPVLIDNGIHGLIGISGEEIGEIKHFSDLLHIVSKRVSGVLTNASLHKSTKLLALTDGLTGLLNRRAFYDRLRSEYERYRRYGSHLSLIVADFDNLKQINDNYGHPMGDEMIKRIGDILREASRESDVLARYGGDEFVIVLPQTNTTNAMNMAERIRYKIETLPFALEGKEIYSTISMGVATAPYKEINSSEELLEAADKALYESKRSGKNRVCVYSR